MHVPCQVFTIRDDALTIDAATPAATRKRCQALTSVPASAGHDAARHIIPRFSTLYAVQDHRATLIIARMLRQQQAVRSSGQQQGRHGQARAGRGSSRWPGRAGGTPQPLLCYNVAGVAGLKFFAAVPTSCGRFQPLAAVSSRFQQSQPLATNSNHPQSFPAIPAACSSTVIT